MSESFFINGPVCDTRYAAVRDDELPMSVAARAFVEQIWREAGPYLDSESARESDAAVAFGLLGAVCHSRPATQRRGPRPSSP